jgi:hypothetical protein
MLTPALIDDDLLQRERESLPQLSDGGDRPERAGMRAPAESQLGLADRVVRREQDRVDTILPDPALRHDWVSDALLIDDPAEAFERLRRE